MTYLERRLMPALQHAYPSVFSADDNAHLTIVMDRAPYHCASTGGRFNPLDPVKKPSRAVLTDNMCAIMSSKGVAAPTLAVTQTVPQGAGAPPIEVVLNVALTDEEKGKKGKIGVSAYIEELRVAAYAWLIANAPNSLLNNVEAYLHANFPRVHVLWSAPNCPELNPIEMVWAQGKLYVAYRYTGARSKAQLRRDLHDGLYTARLAKPAQVNVRGGNFVADPATGKCLAAEALFDHVHFSRKGGVMTAIRMDSVLKVAGGAAHTQKIGELKFTALSALQAGDVVDAALQHTSLAQVKWLTLERLRKLPAAGNDAAGAAADLEFIHGFAPDAIDEA
jgi:hypothetical protein